MLTESSCDLFNLPFFQFAQMKKYCPEDIPLIKAKYKQHWTIWKALHLTVSQQLGQPFAPPHIEKWCNGWQVRAHFFAYYKYVYYQDSAAILSVILNRRRLSVSLDWHRYRAERSKISLSKYNQWLELMDHKRYQEFDIWRGRENEYANFRPLKVLSEADLMLEDAQDFFRIGKNIEKSALETIDSVAFIYQTICELTELYESCHR